MNKSKISEEEVRKLINAESWLGAAEMAEKFNVTLIDEEKTAVASVSSDLFKNYKNTPDFLKNSLKNVQNNKKIEENAQKNEEIDKNEPISSENSQEISENAPILEENQSKEEEIKAKLNLVNISLKIKSMKEKERI